MVDQTMGSDPISSARFLLTLGGILAAFSFAVGAVVLFLPNASGFLSGLGIVIFGSLFITGLIILLIAKIRINKHGRTQNN